MKYRFAGGQDVPEWILAEVGFLSKISCVRLKLICRQVISELAGGECDFEKVAKLIPKDSGFTWSDVKATVSALAFILSSAVKYDVDHTVLNTELQQLGLPKENSDGISRPFRIHKPRIQAQAHSESLRLPRLLSVDFRVDHVVATNIAGQLKGANGAALPEPIYTFQLGLSHAASTAPTRIPTQLEGATPLLLEAQATLKGRVSGTSAAARHAATEAVLDKAMLALGASPLAPTDLTDAPPTKSSHRQQPSISSVLSSAAVKSTSTAAVEPKEFVTFMASAEQAKALLAELRIAQKIVRNINAAFNTSASGGADAKIAEADTLGEEDV